MDSGGPGHLHHAVQLFLRLVVREDVFKVKVLGRQVEGVQAGLGFVEEFSFGIGEGTLETGGAGIGDQLDFGESTWWCCGGCGL